MKNMNSHQRNLLSFAVLIAVIVGGGSYIYHKNQQIQDQYNQERVSRAELSNNLAALQPNDFTLGATDAELSLVVYTDTDCQFCRDYEPTLEQLLDSHGDLISVTYRNFDLPIYPHSRLEHVALECVGNLSDATTYQRFQNEHLFEKEFTDYDDYQKHLTTIAAAYAQVSPEEMTTCMESDAITQQLRSKEDVARLLGVRQTPTTLFVKPDGSHELAAGAFTFESLIQHINSELYGG